jgi:hypothetical protein
MPGSRRPARRASRPGSCGPGGRWAARGSTRSAPPRGPGAPTTTPPARPAAETDRPDRPGLAALAAGARAAPLSSPPPRSSASCSTKASSGCATRWTASRSARCWSSGTPATSPSRSTPRPASAAPRDGFAAHLALLGYGGRSLSTPWRRAGSGPSAGGRCGSWPTRTTPTSRPPSCPSWACPRRAFPRAAATLRSTSASWGPPSASCAAPRPAGSPASRARKGSRASRALWRGSAPATPGSPGAPCS